MHAGRAAGVTLGHQDGIHLPVDSGDWTIVAAPAACP